MRMAHGRALCAGIGRGLATALLFLFIPIFMASCATGGKTLRLETSDVLAQLANVTAQSSANGAVVRVYSNRKLEYSSYRLAEPSRIAVELANVAPGAQAGRKITASGLVTSVSVVHFKKSNIARIELAVASDAKVSFSQKQDFLDIYVSPEGSQSVVADRVPAGMGEGNALSSLEGENGTGKYVAKLEEENRSLKRQLEEAGKQLEEAEKVTKVMQSRVELAEKQLDELESKISGKPPESQGGPLLGSGGKP